MPVLHFLMVVAFANSSYLHVQIALMQITRRVPRQTADNVILEKKLEKKREREKT